MKHTYMNFLMTLEYKLDKRKIFPYDLVRIIRMKNYTSQLIDNQFAIVFFIDSIYYDWDVIDEKYRDRVELIKIKDLKKELLGTLKYLSHSDL